MNDSRGKKTRDDNAHVSVFRLLCLLYLGQPAPGEGLRVLHLDDDLTALSEASVTDNVTDVRSVFASRNFLEVIELEHLAKRGKHKTF